MICIKRSNGIYWYFQEKENLIEQMKQTHISRYFIDLKTVVDGNHNILASFISYSTT